MHETKQTQCERLYQLAEQERRTTAACAKALGISEYQVRQLRQDPDYLAVQRSRRAEQRAIAITRVHDLGQLALETLQQLMLTGKSELVRMQAASKIGDWLNLGQEFADNGSDDVHEARSFLKTLIERAQVHVTIDSTPPMTPPEPGGLLPEQFAGWQPLDTEDLVIDAAPSSIDSHVAESDLSP